MVEEEGEDEAAVEVKVEVAVVVVRPTGGSRGGVSRRRVCRGLPTGGPEAADVAVEAVPFVAALAVLAAESVVDALEGDVEVVKERWGD